jgi:ferrochelatase
MPFEKSQYCHISVFETLNIILGSTFDQNYKMKGYLLINLGSPDSYSPKDVKNYLKEFLMDEKVIDIPYWKRSVLVKGIILNVRPKKSARAYQKVWTEEGSPLIVNSEKLTNKVKEILGDEVVVQMGMRYGNPSTRFALEELNKKGVTELLVLPLYPQHAMSTTDTVGIELRSQMKELELNWPTTVIPAFFDNEEYLVALSNSIKSQIDVTKYDQILFSYHGLPERHMMKTDPGNHCKVDGSCCKVASESHRTCYRHQCFEVTKEMSTRLGLAEGQAVNCFQSRLGRAEWLKPYTAKMLEELPEQGIKKIAVVTPAFVADCLETLEEMGIEGKSDFLAAGGERFDLVTCLNEDEDWSQVVANWYIEWAKK